MTPAWPIKSSDHAASVDATRSNVRRKERFIGRLGISPVSCVVLQPACDAGRAAARDGSNSEVGSSLLLFINYGAHRSTVFRGRSVRVEAKYGTHAELLLAFWASTGFKLGDFMTIGMNEKRAAWLCRVLSEVTHRTLNCYEPLQGNPSWPR
jgi:hypothetical protein